MGRRDRPRRPRAGSGQADGARSVQARRCHGGRGQERPHRRLHGRRRALRLHLQVRVERRLALPGRQREEPARRRHAPRREVRRRRQRFVDSPDDGPSRPRRGLPRPGRTVDLHPRGSRHRRCHPDGPPRVELCAPRREHLLHADEQQPPHRAQRSEPGDSGAMDGRSGDHSWRRFGFAAVRRRPVRPETETGPELRSAP